MDDLVERVRNADELLMDDLIHALAYRFEEVRPDYELLFFAVERKRDFCEQADEFIRFMQGLKEMKIQKKNKVIPFSPHKQDHC